METDKEIIELEKTFETAGPFKPIESPVGKFWKDKSGKKISYKEFMRRWGEGMKGVTQYQQVKMQLNSTYIMLIGILCGFVITFFNLKNLWWLSIILGAAFFNTGVSALGLWQKKVALGDMEKMLEGADIPEPKEYDEVFKKVTKEVKKQNE